MLDGRADIAVHSMKDVPMEFPEGLELGVICTRENAQDAFVSNKYQSLNDLPHGAVVGTSSLRRQCQIQQLRPDLVIESLRGNVQTRLKKLRRRPIRRHHLAAAGLIRMEFSDRIASFIPIEQSCPQVAKAHWALNGELATAPFTSLLSPYTTPIPPPACWPSVR